MKWIGLTGGIACGKSTVSHKLKKKGFPVVDADEIAREVVKPGTAGLKSVVQEFGEGVVTLAGELDRKKLGQLVFGRVEQRKKLESILHPLIQTETLRRRTELENRGEPVGIYDIPLLFEIHAESQFDYIIVVTCSREQQKQRLKNRNHLSEKEIEERLAAQIPLAVKEKAAHFVFDNSRDEKNLEEELARLITWLQKLKPN